LGRAARQREFWLHSLRALSSVTNPLGIKVVTMKRDNLNRVTNVVDATGVSIAYQYDALGRLWKLIDPQLASPVVYVYDNFDRVIAIQMPAGTNYYSYDPKMGWLTSQTDMLGRTTRYDRDPKPGMSCKPFKLSLAVPT